MILRIASSASGNDEEILINKLKNSAYRPRLVSFNGNRVIISQKDLPPSFVQELRNSHLIDEVIVNNDEFALSGKTLKSTPTQIEVGSQLIGAENGFNIIAGPCAIESKEQLELTAAKISELGIKFIRGGAYKPRTSPYSFQGLGEKGLRMIREVADKHDLLVVTELMDIELLDEVEAYSDILQIGSRNMHNYHLLKNLGRATQPVLLKRGMNATIKEWLLAAEYILQAGNEKVILCERGIRTFDDSVRNTMDIAAIAMVKQLSHLPIWADPSQGSGVRELITPLSMASMAAGADGLMVEVHPDPEKALSDGPQSITFDQLEKLTENLQRLSSALGKNLYLHPENLV